MEEIYRVVELFGDYEPWWFLDGWEEDIVSEKEYSNLNEACKAYSNQWKKMYDSFEKIDSRKNYLAAFWNKEEERWCDECEDYLQQFHGLALLKNNQAMKEVNESMQLKTSKAKRRDCMFKNKRKM